MDLAKFRVAGLLNPVVAAIPNDDRVRDTINSGTPFVLKYYDSMVSKQIFKVASTISEVELYPTKGERKLGLGFLKKQGK